MRLLLGILIFHVGLSQNIQVNTSRGEIIGYHVDLGNNTQELFYGEADVFLGIPYVQPPTGALRFKFPQKLTNFPNQPWNATYYRPKCPQFSANYAGIDEDCLYLNIFTPNASSTVKYPVMFWIHGGALVTGSAEAYAPVPPMGVVRNFISRGVVVVTHQYRLGLLGFFTTGTSDFPPNLGMLDQVEAMRFVRDEISNFGGDPSKITIFGQSAGAGSVSAHTYSPLSRGLFQQAIMESGAVWTSLDHTSVDMLYLSASRANSLCNYTREKWNLQNYDELKECMSKTDWRNFLSYDEFNEIGWKIVVDKHFMPDWPRNLAKTRPNIPILLGSNKDEWAWLEIILMMEGFRQFTAYNKTTLVQNLQEFAPHLLPRYPDLTSVLANVYASRDAISSRGANESDHLFWLKSNVDVFSGAFFTAFMAREVGQYLANNNTNVYLYEFTWPSTVVGFTFEGYNPVYHSQELFYLWMQCFGNDWRKFNLSSDSFEIGFVDSFSEHWTNFAKYGFPGGNWTAVSNQVVKQYYEFGATQGMRNGYRMVDQYVWNSLVPQLVGHWPLESNVTDVDNTTPTVPRSSVGKNKFYSFLLFIVLLIYKI